MGINQLEMWQADSFDPKRIDLELGWAESLGMNTMRVYLHDPLWQQDSEGFKRRLVSCSCLPSFRFGDADVAIDRRIRQRLYTAAGPSHFHRANSACRSEAGNDARIV